MKDIFFLNSFSDMKEDCKNLCFYPVKILWDTIQNGTNKPISISLSVKLIKS